MSLVTDQLDVTGQWNIAFANAGDALRQKHADSKYALAAHTVRLGENGYGTYIGLPLVDNRELRFYPNEVEGPVTGAFGRLALLDAEGRPEHYMSVYDEQGLQDNNKGDQPGLHFVRVGGIEELRQDADLQAVLATLIQSMTTELTTFPVRGAAPRYVMGGWRNVQAQPGQAA